MTRTATLAALALLPACIELDVPHQPTLAEVSADADAALDLLDRDAILADAVESQAGERPDLANAPAGFLMQVETDEALLEETDGAADDSASSDSDAPDAPAAPATFQNFAAASVAVLWADVATAAVLAPPAAAIGIASQGEVTEVQPWLWNATNSVTGPDGLQATVDLNVAWVGVGWLAEMRLSTSDGRYDDTLWFNGFLAYGGGLGWWDVYADGDVVGVVEWLADGQGNAEFGIAALQGEVAGDVLGWLSNDLGEDMVSYYDASLDFTHSVYLAEDRSGEVVLSTWNEGEPSCWDSDYADTDC